MSDERKYDEIPAAACCMVMGEPELGDNGEGAKSAPVRLVARTGKPIEHWYWGNVVPDLAGMRVHKSRLPIDYAHDSKEVIGYLNRFDVDSGDLVTSGALVPFRDSDRATEIIHKAQAGVPYEASINFGGDGIKVEEIAEGQVAQVNGYQFAGPGVVIREWPLRGVAICPYGADANTESAVMASGDKTFAAALVTAAAATEEHSMSEASVDAAAEQAETPEAAELERIEAVEVEDNEAQDEAELAVESDSAVETPEAEADESAELSEDSEDAANEDEQESELPAELSRDEFTRIADEFGAEIAVQTVRDGGNYQTALAAAYSAAKAECEELRERVSGFAPSGRAAPVGDAEDRPSLFKSGK